MFKGYKIVKESVRHYPLQLLELKDKKLIQYAESFLKYDTGFEIECHFKDSVYYLRNETINKFKQIPNIINVDCDSSESRFRIPKGIKGLICLYEICKLLKETHVLNLQSGIHYHIDFNDVPFHKIGGDFRDINQEWILTALDSWGYKGNYNERKVSFSKEWVRIHTGYNTFEFRIGEMTFDYSLMIKRIIHCQNISYKIKRNLKDSLKSSCAAA